MPLEKVLTKKSLGVLMHPSSIPGGYVCGTFGRGAKEWIKSFTSMGLNTGNFYLLHLLTLKGLLIVHHLVLHLTHGFSI